MIITNSVSMKDCFALRAASGTASVLGNRAITVAAGASGMITGSRSAR